MAERETNPARRLIVALDVPTTDAALTLATSLSGRVGMFKIGLELFLAEGPAVVRTIRARVPDVEVFLDLKLHDIPNTLRGAIRSVRGLGVRFVTVHASSGVAHLEACVDAAAGELGILAVTVLTSQDAQASAEAGHTRSVAELVAMRTACALASGCEGVVCSGEELVRVGELAPSLAKVVPGIRPPGSELADQKRVMTPARALALGATHLVIGRPITHAPDPAAAAEAIAASLVGP